MRIHYETVWLFHYTCHESVKTEPYASYAKDSRRSITSFKRTTSSKLFKSPIIYESVDVKIRFPICNAFTPSSQKTKHVTKNWCYLIWIGRSRNEHGDLTHRGRDEIDNISQTTSSSAFSWIKMFELWLKFQWSLFPRVQLATFQHWFR